MVSDWREHLCPIRILSLRLNLTGGWVSEERSHGKFPNPLMTHPSPELGFVGLAAHGKTRPGNCEDFGLIFAKPHLSLHGDTVTVWHLHPFLPLGFTYWGSRQGCGLARAPHLTFFYGMFYTCSTDGCRSSAAPFGSWLPKSSLAFQFIRSFENLKLTKRNKSDWHAAPSNLISEGQACRRCCFHPAPVPARPLFTHRLHNPQRHQVAE